MVEVSSLMKGSWVIMMMYKRNQKVQGRVITRASFLYLEAYGDVLL